MRREGQVHLHKAKAGKNDEFYTQLVDIERELQHYTTNFKDKTVFCNCDDFKTSNFFKYFVDNFKALGLKKLLCSCYRPIENPLLNCDKNLPNYYYEYNGDANGLSSRSGIRYFKGDGDFRSPESINLLRQADIVVTNPPFSLFRSFLNLLIKKRKKFLVIANINAITYKDVFSLIQSNDIWLGENLGRGISGFIVPDKYDLYGLETNVNQRGERIISSNNCLWLTNMSNNQRSKELKLTKVYKGHENDYPFFDNYKAINVNKTKDIPLDYKGEMGVPITFLHKYNPKQFEIIRFRKGNDDKDLRIKGKQTYFRIIIKPVETRKSMD